MEESVGVGVKRLHASGDEIWRSVQRAIRIVNHQIPDTLSLNHTLTIKSGPATTSTTSTRPPHYCLFVVMNQKAENMAFS